MPGIRHIHYGFSLLILMFLISMLFSCDSSGTFDEMKRIHESNWNRQEKFSFDFTITDTAAYYNVYVQIRNTTDYPYSNLFLFLTTKDPSGNLSKDTLECLLAAPDGKWLGKGMGKLKDNRVLIKKDFRWNTAGNYQLTIEQAMRKEILSGIADIGLRIEKQ